MMLPVAEFCIPFTFYLPQVAMEMVDDEEEMPPVLKDDFSAHFGDKKYAFQCNYFQHFYKKINTIKQYVNYYASPLNVSFFFNTAGPLLYY